MIRNALAVVGLVVVARKAYQHYVYVKELEERKDCIRFPHD